jgi:hypothetical protein
MAKITGIVTKQDVNIVDVPVANKIIASDINEIVSVVNDNDDELSTEKARIDTLETDKADITYVDDEVELAKDYTQIIAGEVATERDRIDAILDVIREPAVYTQPTVSITNVSQYVEKGSSLTNLNVNILFTQNDAGSATGYSLSLNNVVISTNQNNTIDINNITSNKALKGAVTYNQGAVKNDNLGLPDPSGQIPASTKESSTRTITPTFKNFLGFSSNTVLTSAQIIALANGDLDTNRARNYTGLTAGAGNYLFYCYPASYGNLSSVILDGASPVLGAFTKLANVSVTNAFGVVEDYIVYRSNAVNAFNNNSLNFS